MLGGITVLFYLPPIVSMAHGVLAQTFFVVTIFIAYSLSNARSNKNGDNYITAHICPSKALYKIMMDNEKTSVCSSFNSLSIITPKL